MREDPGNYDHFRETFDRHVVRSEVHGEGFGSWLLHELLSERPPKRTRFERVQRIASAWLRGGVLALLRGDHE